MADSIFRQKLRELREAEGVSCKELGKTLNMSDQKIQKIEVGRTVSIEPESIVRLANFFSVSCDELLTGVKPENAKVNKDLHLSDAAIDELYLNKQISGIISDLLNPDYKMDNGCEIPVGQLLLMELDKCINQDWIISPDVNYSDISVFKIKKYIDILRGKKHEKG